VTQSSSTKTRIASKVRDGELRDIALSETAAGVSDQKQGLVREGEAKSANLALEEPQRASTTALAQQPAGQFQPATPQGWAPPAPSLPQQQSGFVQVIGN
jgi:hypothetical protein